MKNYPLIKMIFVVLAISLLILQGTNNVNSSINLKKIPGTTIILSRLNTITNDIVDDLSTIDRPWGIDNNGTHIFVSQIQHDRINIHDLDGNYVSTLISDSGSGLGQINGPVDVIDNGTHIIILENVNARVQIFDSDMNYVDHFNDTTYLVNPIRMHHNGTHIFVLDISFNKLQLFDAAGNYVAELFNSTQLLNPRGLYVTEEFIYISHVFSSQIISKYDHQGNFLGGFGTYERTEFDVTSASEILIYENFIFIPQSSQLNIYNLDGTPQAAIYEAHPTVPFVKLTSNTIVNDRLYLTDFFGDAIHVFAINVHDVSVSQGNDNVRVSWAGPSANDGANVTHFNIYRGESSGNYHQIAQLGSDTMHFQDTAIQSGKTYYYAVTAVNDFGETEYSDEVSITIESNLDNIEPVIITQFETLSESDSSDDGFVSLNLTLIPITATLIVLLRRRNK